MMRRLTNEPFKKALPNCKLILDILTDMIGHQVYNQTSLTNNETLKIQKRFSNITVLAWSGGVQNLLPDVTTPPRKLY